MLKGFIFDNNKCVGCNACSAACILENRWTIHPRTIFTFSTEKASELLLTNISLACNHCDKPVCLEGCPSSSYRRDSITGAIILDNSKCIGCKYCQWNCPYDAPKYDEKNRTIGKCHLCYTGLTEGLLPACTRACPTGALDYGAVSKTGFKNVFPWFPDKNLNPALELKNEGKNNPLKIVPGKIFDSEMPRAPLKENSINGHWSLVIFSYLVSLSVAIITSSIIDGIFPDKFLVLLIIIIAGLSSFFHLGRWIKAWRSVINVRSSPLSREIVLFILYSVISAFAVFLQIPGLLLASSITGLVLLIVIDSVYTFADNRNSVYMHSGQTFISALIIISFISGLILPLLFIGIIKVAASFYTLAVNRKNSISFVIRFIRIALLLITGTYIVSKVSYYDPVILYMFLIGELFDRILFYTDFNPQNINLLINTQIADHR